MSRAMLPPVTGELSLARVLLTALGATAVAALVRLALNPWLGGQYPYTSFYGAVAVAAWFGGTRAGLTTLLLSVPSALYLFVAPQNGLYPLTVADTLGAVSFSVGALIILAFAAAVHRAARDLRDQRLRAQRGEHEWRQLAESLPQLVWTCEPDGACSYLSRQWVSYTGVPQAEHLGLGWLDAVHPSDRDEVKAAWAAACASRSRYQISFRLRRADGSYRWFFSRALPLLDEDGRVTRWFGSSTDINSERTALVASRLTSERFQALVDVTVSVIWSVDGEGLMDGEHRSWADFTGQTRDAYSGMGWLDALTSEDQTAFLDVWRSAQVARTSFKASGRLWSAQFGAYRRFEARVAPVLAEDGSVREWIGKFMDVHDQYEAERRIYRLVGELREADAQKDEFLASLSHELRGPIAPIRNAAAVLARIELPEPYGRARDAIGRQVQLLARVVDDLLDSSRLRFDRLSLVLEPVLLTEVIENAVDQVMPAVTAVNQQLELHCGSDAIWVTGDRARLAQVFANLLTNAAKFSPPGGRIALTVGHDAREVTVTVRDWGAGIDPELVPKVFDRFFQAPHAGSSSGGLGLGLSLVKNLVERHGGRVAAASEGVGHGCEFSIVLPMTESVEHSAQPPRVESSRAGLRRMEVLVVDDNRDSADTLAALLELSGISATSVHNGSSALRAVAEHRPDVVLLDLGMPEMDGYEVCRQLWEQYGAAKPRLVALTGWGQSRDIQRTREAGFDFHMTKPIELNALLKLLAPMAEGVAVPPAGILQE